MSDLQLNNGVWVRQVPWQRLGVWRTDIQSRTLKRSDMEIAEFRLTRGPTVQVPRAELIRVLADSPRRKRGSIVGPFNINPTARTVGDRTVHMEVSYEALRPRALEEDLKMFRQFGGTGGCVFAFAPLIEPDNRPSFRDLEGFVCAVYVLNIIDLGLRKYFPQNYSNWCRTRPDFPHMQPCDTHVGLPRDLLGLFRRSTEIRPIRIAEVLTFYLGTLLKDLPSGALAEKLLNDPDFRELKPLLSRTF